MKSKKIILSVIAVILIAIISAIIVINPYKLYLEKQMEVHRQSAMVLRSELRKESETEVERVRTSDSYSPDSWNTEREKEDSIHNQEKSAMDATWQVWDFDKGTLTSKGTHDAIKKAEETVNELADGNLKNKLIAGIQKAEDLLTKREKEAQDAVNKVWDKENDKLPDNISRELISDAQKKTDILPKSKIKEELNAVIIKADDALTEKENIQAAQKSVDAIYDSQSGTLKENVDEDDISSAQTAVLKVKNETTKADLQNKVDKADELLKERRKAEKQAKRDAINDNCPNDNGLGNAGCLYIPDVGLSVKLYSGTQSTSSDQAIVDRSNSAIYVPRGYYTSGCKWIADHKHQGFSKIKEVEPGYTKAYVRTPGGNIETYKCTKIFKGHNYGDVLTDGNGDSIDTENQGGLGMYTCNENWKNITIVYWQPI